MSQSIETTLHAEQATHQFRHQGKLVEAVQYDGTLANAAILQDFAGKSVAVQGFDGSFGNAVSIRLVTPFGSRLLYPSDWVVSNGRGDYAAINDSLFTKQHEQVGEN